jgi:SnoaL-like protein
MRSNAFRRAVEALDLEATMATFSSSLVMHSPVRDEPLHGKESMAPLFASLLRVFEDLRFVGSYRSVADGAELLHFRWRLGDQEVEGVDLLHFDDEGLIDEYTVMIRPLSALVGLRDAVWSQL